VKPEHQLNMANAEIKSLERRLLQATLPDTRRSIEHQLEHFKKVRDEAERAMQGDLFGEMP